jgi:ParB-like chromosome segregation protein Spo0J
MRTSPASVNRGFEDDCVTLPIDAILPLRALGKNAKSSRKYRQIVASIAQIGIVEPPVVVRNPDSLPPGCCSTATCGSRY